MLIKLKSETTISLLMAIVVFTILLTVFSRWQANQNRRSHLIFQKQQAMQILDNQIALNLAEADCEASITRNGVFYVIQCSNDKFSIRFPLGKIELITE